MTCVVTEQLTMTGFMNDYNKCQKLTLELDPEIEPLRPPEPTIFTDGYGIQHIAIRYGENEAYYRQLVDMIEANCREQSYVA